MSKKAIKSQAPERIEGIVSDYSYTADPADPNNTLYHKLQIGNQIFNRISVVNSIDKIKYAHDNKLPVTLFVSNFRGYKAVMAMACEGKLYSSWQSDWAEKGWKLIKRARLIEIGMLISFVMMLIAPAAVSGRHTHVDSVINNMHFATLFIMLLIAYASKLGFFGKVIGKHYLLIDSQKQHILEMTKNDDLEHITVHQ